MSTSFPFLKIARDFDLPYGQVIRYAESIWWCLVPNPLSTTAMTAIYDAVINERGRRLEATR